MIDGETAENNPDIEAQWAVLTYEHAEAYYLSLQSTLPSTLTFTPIDSDLYVHFRTEFPDLNVAEIDELADFKSEASKAKWRAFIMQYEKLNDFNFGTMLRVRVGEGYSGDNALFCTRLQFWCVELARNRESQHLYPNLPRTIDANKGDAKSEMADEKKMDEPLDETKYIKEKLAAKSIKELKALMKARGVSDVGCVEKADLVGRLLN